MTLRVGDPSGYGLYGVLDRDWSSVLCHECGRRFASVGSHIVLAHDMTAAEYRREHGLSRSQPLVSEEISAHKSARARARIGSPAWERLEAARDPLAASAAREAAGWTGVPPPSRLADMVVAASQLPKRPRRVRTCPVCEVQHTRRGDCCGAAGCVSALRAEAARREMADRYRPLTDGEVAALRAASGDGLDVLVRRLQGDRVSSAAIGRALGRSSAWMTARWPQTPICRPGLARP